METYSNRTSRKDLVSYDDDSFDESDCSICWLNDRCKIENNEIESAKSRILKHLTPEEHQLFIQMYEKHMKYSDIGKELNISESAVGMRSLHMRVKIKKWLSLPFCFSHKAEDAAPCSSRNFWHHKAAGRCVSFTLIMRLDA